MSDGDVLTHVVAKAVPCGWLAWKYSDWPLREERIKMKCHDRYPSTALMDHHRSAGRVPRLRHNSNHEHDHERYTRTGDANFTTSDIPYPLCYRAAKRSTAEHGVPLECPHLSEGRPEEEQPCTQGDSNFGVMRGDLLVGGPIGCSFMAEVESSGKSTGCCYSTIAALRVLYLAWANLQILVIYTGICPRLKLGCGKAYIAAVKDAQGVHRS